MAEKNSLWKNIRANRGSGKKPTAEMLKQERKIKAKQYAEGGEDELPTYRYANKEGVIGGPVQTPRGTSVPMMADGTPVVNLPEFEVISTPTSTYGTPNPYSPITGEEFLNSGFNPINWLLPNTEQQVQPIDPKTGMPLPQSGGITPVYPEMALLPAKLPFNPTSKLGKTALFVAETQNPGLKGSPIKNTGNYEKGLKKIMPEKEYLTGKYKQHAGKELKKAALAFSPSTTKALGKLDDSIAKRMLYDYRFGDYSSVKDFRKAVKQATLESERLKKIHPTLDFGKLDGSEHWALKDPKTLKQYADIQLMVDKSNDSQKSFMGYLGKDYNKKMDLINQNETFKNIANESPQYTDIIHEHLKNPKVTDDEFVTNLVKQSNTFNRAVSKPTTVEEFLTLKGKSLSEGKKNTIDVEGFPVSGDYGSSRYKMEPNAERMAEIAATPIEQRWAQRFPENFTRKNENVNFKEGWLNQQSEAYKNWWLKRLERNRTVHNVPMIKYPKELNVPIEYINYPQHGIFTSELGDQPLKGFDVSKINIDNPHKYIPGFTRGLAEGGYYPTQGPPKALFKGYANGGYTNPYNQYQKDSHYQYEVGGKVWKNIAAGLYGAGEGILDTVTGGATDQLTDRGFEALTKAGNKNIDLNDPDDVKFLKTQQKVKGYTNAAGAIGTAIVTGNVQGAIKQGSKGLNTAFQATDGMSDNFKQWSQGITGVVGVASGFAGGLNSDSFNTAQQATQATEKAGTGVKTFGQKISKATPFANQALGMIGGGQQPLWQQGEARQDFLNSPEQLALKQQQNQGYINQGLNFSTGGNITNNSLNLRNTMRYKRFAKGGTFDQYGINLIPESAGLHHQSAYGGVPIGPDALAEGGEIKMDTGDGGQYIVSDQVDGAETQRDFMFSKGGKYKELNRTLADGMKQDLSKYTFGSLATSDRVKGDLRRPNDSYGQSTIEQIKQKWQQKTEYARQRSQQEQAIAQAEGQKRLAEEEYIAAYGGRINPKKYPGLNMTKKAKGGYVHNQMIQPMLAEGGPLYGDPASPYTYAYGGMYGDPYYRGGEIDYTNDMYSSYAGGGPMVSNVPQAFKGPAAQNRGGMYIYPDGGMMPPEQQMMQQQQMQQQQMQQQQGQMPQQGGQDQMMQMVQQVMEALMQGTPPEQIMQQLVQSGVPPEQAQQIIQVAMQEAQGQQQPMQEGQQPMQGQEEMMLQEMAHGGMYPDGGKKVYTDLTTFQNANTAYKDSLDTYSNVNAINTRINSQIAKPANQRSFSNQSQFKPWMAGLINNAVSSGDINPNLVQKAPVQQIQHVNGPITNYTPITATKPKVRPIFQPPAPITNSPVVTPTPVQVAPVQPTPQMQSNPATPTNQPSRVYDPGGKGRPGRWLDLNDDSQRKPALLQNKANQVSAGNVNMLPFIKAEGGYFNGRKQYGPGGGNNGDVVSPDTTNTFSPLADESTMSQIAGLGQAVVPALTSAFAFNKLSKRKLTPSLIENVSIDYTPARTAMMEENRRNVSSGLNAMRNVAPTSGSFMGNARGAILDANKLSGEQISKSWQDQKNKQAEYDYGVGTANAGIKNKINESNEEMYQNAMQTGFESAGQGVKNAASYYADLENRNLQRWQAMNTSGENWTWTPKGKAFRNKDGIYMINGKPVDPSTGNPTQ